MAEEQAVADEVAAAVAPPKKSSKGMIIFILLVLAGAGGGYFAYIKYFQPQMESMGQEEEQMPKTEDEIMADNVMVPLNPFLVNLSRTEGKRFLKVTMTLELNSPEVQAEVKNNTQKILDSILVLLSSKTFEDVYSIQGKFKLKDEITTRVNRFLVMGHVKNVYFSEFVIQ